MSSRLKWVVLLTFTLLLVTAPVAAQNGDTLVVTTLSDISSLDPAIGYDTLSWPTMSLFYRGLVTLKDSQTPEPALAESFEISEDGLTYTFVLRDGILFSNGRAITSEDVKYSFERLLNPATASPTAYMFGMIEGADAFIAGDAEEVSGIRILDERTVEFTLTRPEWTLMQRFALPPGFIVAREGVEAAGEDFGRQPLGAGPFTLVEWQSGVKMLATRNPNYFKPGLPLVDNVEIQIGVEPSVGILRIDNGEADISLDFVPNSDYPRIATDPALQSRLIEITAFPNVQYLIPNTRIEPFNNVDVRRAMSAAIDRERLVQIYNNRAVPAAGPIPPTVSGDNPDVSSVYNPDAARELLAQAGYADGFSTELVTTTDPTDVAIAQAIIADWSAVGINATLVPVEFAQWLDIASNRPEEMPIGYIGWFLDYQDPSNVYEPLVSCAGSFNVGGFCNEEIDAVFQAAKLLPPGDERWNAYAGLESLLVQEMPNINLVHVVNYYYISERVEGLVPDAALLLNFESATINN
ncbi:MAG TPA: ABC transporter substrate-binding protein [Aggregatilineales bacterium]|nr:ABC transporter substrate-binding protein [Aggregatilineales bacterium]